MELGHSDIQQCNNLILTPVPISCTSTTIPGRGPRVACAYTGSYKGRFSAD